MLKEFAIMKSSELKYIEMDSKGSLPDFGPKSHMVCTHLYDKGAKQSPL